MSADVAFHDAVEVDRVATYYGLPPLSSANARRVVTVLREVGTTEAVMEALRAECCIEDRLGQAAARIVNTLGAETPS